MNYLSILLQATQLAQVQAEEQEMLEAQSTPLRNYLMQHVMPTLTQGLIEVCKVKPEDAVDYLVCVPKMGSLILLTVCISLPIILQAEYLFKHNPQID